MTHHVTTYINRKLAATSHKMAAETAMSAMLGRTWEPDWMEEPTVYRNSLLEFVFAPDVTGLIQQMYRLDCTQNLDGTYDVELAYVAGYDYNRPYLYSHGLDSVGRRQDPADAPEEAACA